MLRGVCYGLGVSGDLWAYAGSLAASALVSGFAGGLFGIGGGLLRIPIFLYLFPAFGVAQAVTMHVSAGTSLAVAVPSSAAAAWAQYRAGNLDAAFLRWWIPALAVGVVIGLVISRFVPGQDIKGLFAGVVFVAGLQLMLASENFELRDHLGPLGSSLAASAIGALSALLGLTGGTFVTPTLTAFGYSIHRAIAVASTGGVLISAIGAGGYIVNGWSAVGTPAYSLGYVDGLAFAIMTPIVLIAAPLGVRVANRLPKKTLKRVFGGFLLIVALDMARDVFFGG